MCHDPFTPTYTATQILWPLQCRHIFGYTCLTAWLDSPSSQSNTCPMCRETLFAKGPVLTPGARPGNANWRIQGLRSAAHAWTFVNVLRLVTTQLAANPRVYDSDIEYVINPSMRYVCDAYGADFQGGLWVDDEGMAGLAGLAKEMVMAPLEEGLVVGSGDRVVNAEWFAKIAGVLGRELEGG